MSNKEKENKKKKIKVKQCPRCGIHLAEQMRFCFGCGYLFSDEEKETVEYKPKNEN